MILVGSFYEAHDGRKDVAIAFVVKNNVSGAIKNAYTYLDCKCNIAMNQVPFIGIPYLGKMTKNKYVLSILFPKEDNPGKDQELLQRISALSSVSNIEMKIEVISTVTPKRVDPMFWEKIKKTLMEIASYYGSQNDWEEHKAHVKTRYEIRYSIGTQMTYEEAEYFYDCVLEYAKVNNIPIKEKDPLYDEVAKFISGCRKDKVCCVCKSDKLYDNTVYPLCQTHYDEYLSMGKQAFDNKHLF